MKKFFSRFLLMTSLCIVTSPFFISHSFAGVPSIPGSTDLAPMGAGTVQGGDSLEKLQNGGLQVLHTVKVIISFLAVIYIVYSGIVMVTAMGDEKQVATQKMQLMYTLVAFLFVNIPGQIYALFSKKSVSDVTVNPTTGFTDVPNAGSNIFVNFFNWHSTVEQGILSFIRVGVIGITIFMFTLAGFEMITSAWDEEKQKHAKGRFLYGTLALIFIAIIEGWVQVVYSGDIGKGQNIFAQIANLALFFAGPTAIFFLLLGGYYFVTSAWEEGKVKKWKAIVLNTFIAVIILLASYAFLKDLADFSL